LAAAMAAGFVLGMFALAAVALVVINVKQSPPQ
jgi:hypothetical protein